MTVPYRDFYYPLNVFMHVLTLEEGRVEHLHYGLFAREGEPISVAQERSTELLFTRLPPPPARVLDVGIGLGTTLRRMLARGYEATGITPDEKQLAMAGDDLPVLCKRFEEMTGAFDVLVFQESSQYIDSDALFAKAAELAPRAIVLDEFALQPEGVLHRLDDFMAAASRHGFAATEQLDLSANAPPSIDYFIARFPRYRAALIADLGLTGAQVDELIADAARYAAAYRRGVYGYWLLDFTARTRSSGK